MITSSPFDLSAFFEGLRCGQLLLPVSPKTGRWLAPGVAGESGALLKEITWRPASGKGEITSYAVYRRAYIPQLAEHVPYAVVTVRLIEGPCLLGRIKGIAAEDIKVGMPVAAEMGRNSSCEEGPFLMFWPVKPEELGRVECI